MFINDIINKCNKCGISISIKRRCGGLFADEIVLCASTRSQFKKLLKLASKLARNNKMQFGINKCASLVVQGEVSKFTNNNSPIYYLSRQELPKNELLYLLRCIVFK
jgi:hypothetical protein